MKRKREMDHNKVSEIKSAIEELSAMSITMNPPVVVDADDDHAVIPTMPFVHVCSLVIEVLDKIGPTMAVLRQDITQNIQRLEGQYEADPSVYSNLVEILKKEASEGISRKRDSCSKAFVWLTRSLDFTACLLQKLSKDPDQNMEQAVGESYSISLKPWHGWISSAAFKVALKLVPDNRTFITILKPNEENYKFLKEDMQAMVSLLVPLLQDIHATLRLYGLDRVKAT
ncbi:Glycolipid transfer protein 3 [Linum perenne]